MNKQLKISIIGLGYVGLPLLVEFSKFFQVVGYDSNLKKINHLQNSLNKNKNITLSNKIEDIKETTYKIICVPTPVDKKNIPDLRLLKKASKIVAKYTRNNDIIIYESTVYPGVTEEICIPLLEKYSSKKCINKYSDKGFFVGYSPERINPGDTKHTLTKVIKVVSGNCDYSANQINKLYNKIIKAGTYLAKDIKTAESAKIIENIQRDVNIALINELSILFNKMNISIYDILDAASTKWNFLNFKPGLVGGHCIGVDPYYLAYKAKKLNFTAKIIESGRKINDKMSYNLVNIFLKDLKKNKKNNKKILILGFTFKEDCEDIRNTKIIDIYNVLKNKNYVVDVYDPIANIIEAKEMYNINLLYKFPKSKYDGIILAVSHKQFKNISQKLLSRISNKNCVIFDIKKIFPKRSYLTI